MCCFRARRETTRRGLRRLPRRSARPIPCLARRVLDEPSEGIQPNINQQIGRVIASLRDEVKIAIFLIEQSFDFAFGLANEFVALNRGSVVFLEHKAHASHEKLLERVSV